jgi:arginase
VIAVLDAPSNLGLREPAPGVEPGVRRLADALRAHGIVERLGARDAGRVEAPPYRRLELNRAAVPGYSRALAKRIGELLDGGEWPLVLGGDCSILLGAMVALKRRGRYGLAFVDGHLDFRHVSGLGAVAGEDLAVVTGRAEPSLADIDGLRPYVRDEDVVALGEREGEGDGIEETAIRVIDLAALRAGEFAAPDQPYWLHVDADVLDLPAVDSPQPGGLSFDELSALLARLLPGAIGMQVTVLDPDLDPDGSQAEGLAGIISASIAREK